MIPPTLPSRRRRRRHDRQGPGCTRRRWHHLVSRWRERRFGFGRRSSRRRWCRWRRRDRRALGGDRRFGDGDGTARWLRGSGLDQPRLWSLERRRRRRVGARLEPCGRSILGGLTEIGDQLDLHEHAGVPFIWDIHGDDALLHHLFGGAALGSPRPRRNWVPSLLSAVSQMPVSPCVTATLTVSGPCFGSRRRTSSTS